jgi:hypothetical protein
VGLGVSCAHEPRHGRPRCGRLQGEVGRGRGPRCTHVPGVYAPGQGGRRRRQRCCSCGRGPWRRPLPGERRHKHRCWVGGARRGECAGGGRHEMLTGLFLDMCLKSITKKKCENKNAGFIDGWRPTHSGPVLVAHIDRPWKTGALDKAQSNPVTAGQTPRARPTAARASACCRGRARGSAPRSLPGRRWSAAA